MGAVKPKSKQGNTTNLNSFSSNEKGELLRWDLNSQHTAYEADVLSNVLPDVLPTEQPRQFSWLDQIKAIEQQPV